MKQNVYLFAFLSFMIGILGTVFSITWSSLQYFILTGFILLGFLYRIYYIYKIYKNKRYIGIPVKCKTIKKNLFEQEMFTYYFIKDNGETVTIKLNKYLHTIDIDQAYIIYYEVDVSGLIKNYIGIELEKEVI